VQLLYLAAGKGMVFMLRRNTNHVIIKFIVDLLLTLAAVWFALQLRVILPLGRDYITEFAGRPLILYFCALVYPAIYLLSAMYDPERTMRAVDEYQKLTLASLLASLVLAGLIYFIERNTSRMLLVYFFVTQFSLMCIWQAIARIILHGNPKNQQGTQRILLVGSGEASQRIAKSFENLEWTGVQLVGYLAPIQQQSLVLPYLGAYEKLDQVLNTKQINDILLTVPSEAQADIQPLVTQVADKSCNVWLVPDYFSMLIYGGRVEELGGLPMISLKSLALSNHQRVAKRIFDLAIGLLMLLLASPLMISVALIIKLTSRGPIFYLQDRIGENQRRFKMIKFRSMVVGADRHERTMIQRDATGQLVHQKDPDDPRVTPIGRFIRRTSIDELPQLFNVLKGDMSLVGPRPEMPVLAEQFEPWQRKRFAVPQGITGWWQVNGRSTKSTHLKTEDDLYYIQNYSLLLDLKILFKTVWVVVQGRGAY
jgi:exopolysaccharide biosynthesis polyprenyl glycosylphosphotransferase